LCHFHTHLNFTTYYLFSSSLVLLDLHSFPTRRSSDLGRSDQGSVADIFLPKTFEELYGAVSKGAAESLRTLSRFSTLEQRSRHRSEEHTSELQSLRHLVCRLLLEKKKNKKKK